MKSTVTKGFWEERSDKHKSHSEKCDDNICVPQKKFSNIIVENHENYLNLSNIITKSKLNLFLSSL